MTFRYVDTGILTDIANAVRERNGEDAAYKPGELPDAVLALDGKAEAAGRARSSHPLARGLVQDSVFKGVANAIRFHSLSSRRYKPRDMASAIRRLDFEDGLKPRALLHDDGTLEFNYHETRTTDLEPDVCEVYPVDASGYADAASVPWLEAADVITSVRIHASMLQAGVADISHWFSRCHNLVEVHGFQNLMRATRIEGLFAGCTRLDTIRAEKGIWWDFKVIESMSAEGKPFRGCKKLVGYDGALVSEEAGAEAFVFGKGGVLIYGVRDPRRFVRGNLYAGGTLTITTSEPTKQYDCIATGKLYAGVAYEGAELMPWHGFENRVKSVQVKQSARYADGLCLDWWFSGCNNIQGFRGLENLLSPVGARHTFEGCDGLFRLELAGLDPRALADVEGMFSGCGNLMRIVVDADWRLPDGCAGAGAFDGCKKLVGGNGTRWSADAVSASMMKIDSDGEAGYLTASMNRSE